MLNNKNGLTEIYKDIKSLDDFREMITGIHMFSELSSEEIDALSNYLTMYKADSGVMITDEGDSEGYMCTLIEGKLEVRKNTTIEDNSKRLTVIRPGSTIGEMTLLDHLPHSATVIASEDSVLLVLVNSMFDKMLVENIQLGLNILKIIARLVSLRLRQTSGVLVDYIQTDENTA